jgi:hypothetical protein
MNELLVIAIIGLVMGVFYGLVYPKAKSITQLQWSDFLATILSLGGAALFFAGGDERFSLVFIETTWYWFTLIVYVLLEVPAWTIYLKRHPHQGTMRQLYNPVYIKGSKGL